ncbi:hypothetical protein GYMLUDRAFT_190181 [Collybiopsis luxurians FD-317 M1]|nr:hypothetical protein GYMLUDRAFT_190181 [Collybiopsis luxurians FD-317 M1]
MAECFSSLTLFFFSSVPQKILLSCLGLCYILIPLNFGSLPSKKKIKICRTLFYRIRRYSSTPFYSYTVVDALFFSKSRITCP